MTVARSERKGWYYIMSDTDIFDRNSSTAVWYFSFLQSGIIWRRDLEGSCQELAISTFEIYACPRYLFWQEGLQEHQRSSKQPKDYKGKQLFLLPPYPLENVTQVSFPVRLLETWGSGAQRYLTFAAGTQSHPWSRALIKRLSTWSMLESRYWAIQSGHLEISVLCLFGDRVPPPHITVKLWKGNPCGAVRH